MKKRFLSIMMALCLTLSLLPATALAADNEVGTAEALATALETGGNIKLIDDITVNTEQDWTITEEVVLDLNGHSITSTYNQSNYFLFTVNGGSLTLNDSSKEGTGKIEIKDASSSYPLQLTGTGSRFTMNGGTISAIEDALDIYTFAKDTIVNINGGVMKSQSYSTLAIRGSNTVVNITDGLIENDGSYGAFVSSGSGSTDPESIIFNMTGGKLTSTGTGILTDYALTVNINDKAEIETKGTGISVKGTTILNIAGGSITAGSYALQGSHNSSINVSGGEVKTTRSNLATVSLRNESTVEISGGTIVGTKVLNGDEENIALTGGTFQTSSGTPVDVTAYLPSGMTQVNGQVVVDTQKAVATVNGAGYDDLQEAIDAAGEGDTVTLLQDEEQDVTIAAGQEITLDLGTYTLKNASGHTITNHGTLTIIGSGTVDNVTHAKGALVNYGTATLEGGTFTRSAERGSSPSDNGGNSWYVIDNHGTMKIDGATVTSDGKYSSLIRNIKAAENEAGSLTVSSGNLSNGFIALKNDTDGTMNITGGTITSGDQAVQNWNKATISGGELTGKVYCWSAGKAPKNDTGNLTISGNAKIDGEVAAIQYQYVDKGQTITPDMAATVTIQGGTVLGQVTTSTRGFGEGVTPSPEAEVTVSNGQFKEPVNREYLDNSLKAELKSASNLEAPYSYYESVEAAKKEAGPNDVITDLKPEGGGGPVTYYTITLNNGNTVYNTYFIKAGEPFTLPSAPSGASNQRFDGWSFHGNLYQPGARFDTISTSMIFDAMWSTVSSGGGSSSSEPSYSPVMDVSKGGSVKVNPRTPGEGDEVTITVDPDRGYEVGDVTVTDRSGRDVRVTAERDGTYTFEQPKGRVTIAVTFVREGTSTFFTDVAETYWAYDEIAWAYENGYVNGVTATTFAPGASISRQQIWMILARIAGDDPADMAAARQWSIDNGISDGTNPGSAVTRQQLAALLYRYAQMMGYANEARVDLSSFPDAGSVASYAVEPMQWSVANSIVGGTTDGTLNPTGTATRAQFAVMLYRFWTGV